MKTVYLTQKFAGKTSQEIREERALLLEAAKNFLGEDYLEVERASKEVADFLLHGAPENLSRVEQRVFFGWKRKRGYPWNC